MKYFVEKHSVVRRIWGSSDTILLIFAGSAAEFALNKAVDWLYYTGRLPSDPLGRLFSTVEYARRIVFSDEAGAHHAIDAMASIHRQLELSRGMSIPDWAYRDVLFMLIDYSIRAFEVLERPLSENEKQEVFNVFYRVGDRMGLDGLPATYGQWVKMRREHLKADLIRSAYTDDLFRQYRRHLGFWRYRLLLEGQVLVVPDHVKSLMGFRRWSLLRPFISIFRLSRRWKADRLLKELLLPGEYKQRIYALDRTP